MTDSLEIDESLVDVHREKLYPRVLADIQSLEALDHPAFNRYAEQPCPRYLVSSTSDDGVELFSYPGFEEECCGGLLDLPFDLLGGVFLIRTVLGQGCQVAHAVWHRLVRDCRFGQALGDEVRIPAIWSSGMCVVPDRKTEVTLGI